MLNFMKKKEKEVKEVKKTPEVEKEVEVVAPEVPAEYFKDFV